MARWSLVSLVSVALAVGAACATPPAATIDSPETIDSADTEPSTTAEADRASGALPSVDVGSLVWEEIAEGVDEATLSVPLDYDDPAAGSVELFLTRHRALQPEARIGALLVNPGGPGFGGSQYALYASEIFDAELLDRFDIIGWDPRGTGESSPAVDCIDDYDRFYGSIDLAPDPFAEAETLARDFAAACTAALGDQMMRVGTNNAARDMDAIRQALGEDQISYFGFSYGSELGAVWATLFPDTVRAAVLDGAADPTADALESSLQQMAGFESTLATFLAACSSTPTCAFHNDGDAEGAFDSLMEQLESAPIDAVAGRPKVGRTIATTGVIMAMYSETYWPDLESALATAAAGDGSGLLALHDTYYQRLPDGTWGDELEAFQVISCADTEERPSPSEEIDAIARLHEVAPRLVPPDAVPSYFCTFFPPPIDPRVDVDTTGAGPIVVIGTTGDASTPLEGTRTMAETLEDGRLVVVESNDHGAYFVSECAREIVRLYLVDLVVPPKEKLCR